MKVIVQVIKKGKSDGAKQRRIQGGATGANAPAILSLAPRGRFTRLCGVT